jgi:ADP-ribose pyrophosphatase YjhB (NUDIX family)
MFRKGEMPVKVPSFVWKTATTLLHFFWRFQRGMTLGVRGLVIDQRGRIFLVKHGYIGGWHMPGGGVETGETLLEALNRELCEEGNIQLAGPPRLHGMFFNKKASRRDHVAVFVVEDFRQESLPEPGYEIAAAAFFPLDALPNDTTAGTRARIAEVLGGAPVSEHW